MNMKQLFCTALTQRRFALTFQSLLALFIASGLASCTICREAAIRDAEQYARRGYEARIATYDLNIDGRMYGAFLWSHHAQAQVYRNEKWYWVCELGGLCEEPTFTIKRIVVLWDVDEYRKAVRPRSVSQPVDERLKREAAVADTWVNGNPS